MIKQESMDRKATKPIPVIPFFQSLVALLRSIKSPMPIMLDNSRKYGAFHGSNIRPGGYTLFITDPEFVGHILQTNNRNYHKTAEMKTGMGRFIGRGLLTSDGDYWLRQRRLIQPEFRRKKLQSLMEKMKTEIDLYGNTIDQYVQTGETFDFAHSMGQLTFNIVTKALFGTGMSKEEFHRVEVFGVEFQRYYRQRVFHPYLLPWLYLFGVHNKCMRLKKQTDAILKRVISDRRASQEPRDDLLDMLLRARYEDTGEGLSDQQLRDESMILLIAGHETAANALSWTLYLLVQHQETIAKLRTELDTVVKEEEIGFTHLEDLEYMRQVLREAMRLYPPIWIADRVALEDDYVNGHLIPKGTVILINIHGLHRNPKYWPDPEKFAPERFAKEKMKQQTRFSYCPFGAGPRLCIGHQFAMMEMQLVIAKLIRKYDWSLVEDQNIELEPLVTLRPKHGIQMRVESRCS